MAPSIIEAGVLQEPEDDGCWPPRCPSCCSCPTLPRPVFTAKKASAAVRNIFPIVDWLGRYKWREDLVGQ